MYTIICNNGDHYDLPNARTLDAAEIEMRCMFSDAEISEQEMEVIDTSDVE